MKTDAEIAELLRKIREERSREDVKYCKEIGEEIEPDTALDLENQRESRRIGLRSNGYVQGRDLYDVDTLDFMARLLDIDYEKLRHMEAVDVFYLHEYLSDTNLEFDKSQMQKFENNFEFMQRMDDFTKGFFKAVREGEINNDMEERVRKFFEERRKKT